MSSWFPPPKYDVLLSTFGPGDNLQQFKKLYRKQLLHKAGADLDSGDSSTINVLNTVYWMTSSQTQIKQ